MLADPLRREVQDDGRSRFRGRVQRPDEPLPRVRRVVTLEDSVTVHNAFLDRTCREAEP